MEIETQKDRETLLGRQINLKQTKQDRKRFVEKKTERKSASDRKTATVRDKETGRQKD
jgi:hypothetical protein